MQRAPFRRDPVQSGKMRTTSLSDGQSTRRAFSAPSLRHFLFIILIHSLARVRYLMNIELEASRLSHGLVQELLSTQPAQSQMAATFLRELTASTSLLLFALLVEMRQQQ
jgi:hypothetical protein